MKSLPFCFVVALLAVAPYAFAEAAPDPDPVDDQTVHVHTVAALLPHDPLAQALDAIGYTSAKATLEERGFAIGLGYTLIFQGASDVDAVSNTLLAGSYDIELTWSHHCENLGSFEVGLLTQGGHVIGHRSDEDLSANVGSILGINGDFDTTDIALTDVWLAWTLPGERAVIIVGKLDQTVFFDTNAIANDETAQFVASPLVNNLSIPFPEQGLGAVVQVRVNERLYVVAGAADATAAASHSPFVTVDDGDWFLALEVGLTVEPIVGREGTYRFMGWATTTEDAEGAGFAISADQSVTERLIVFGRFGLAEREAADFNVFVSAGIGMQAPFSRRDDMLAVGYAWANPSDPSSRAESIIELFYRVQVTGTVAVTPHIQCVINPSDSTDNGVVVIGGLRLQASF